MELPLKLPADFLDRRWLIATSGGIDSMVLTWSLHRAGATIALAHVDYQLRGADSTGDREFLTGFAEQLGIPIHVKIAEPETLRAADGPSLQMAARELRYRFFEETAQVHDYDTIATAHHATDQVETILLNWTRGCGLRGLRGIPAQRGNIFRPLIQVARADIEAYARARRVAFRVDASNQTDAYQRNLIRNQVLPLLRQLNPALERTVVQNVEHLTSLETLVRDFTASVDLTERDDDGTVRIDRQRLLQLGAADTMLWELTREYGFNAQQMHDLLREGNPRTGATVESSDWRLVVESYQLVLYPRDQTPVAGKEVLLENDGFVRGDGWMLFHRVVDYPQDLSATATTVYAPLDLFDEPLTVRTWQPGDFIRPFGMEGRRKKLSDVFKDQKIGVRTRAQTWFLADGAEVLWIPGVKTSERLRVVAGAEQVMRLEFEVRGSRRDS